METVNNSQQVAPPPVAPAINPTPPPPFPQKRKGKLGVIISLLIILLLFSISGVAGFVIYKNLNKQPEQVACTLEAKICPDGSSVGRTGPNCEFSPCPTTAPDPTADWQTYANSEGNYSLRYPNEYKLTENGILSVDGVVVDTPQTTSLLSPIIPDLNSNFQIRFHYETGTSNLTQQQAAAKIGTTSTGNEYSLDRKTGYIFEDTPLGPYGSSIIYIETNSKTYTITIESNNKYSDIEQYVDQILSTFTFD